MKTKHLILTTSSLAIAGLAVAASLTDRAPAPDDAIRVVPGGGAAVATSAWPSGGETQSLALAAVAVTGVTEERMPADADSSNQAAWWVPLAIHAGAHYFAFDAPGATTATHEVKVGKRDTAGAWTFGSLRNTDGTTWSQTDDPGHYQPTIAIDSDGYIHVWADMHNNDWRYFRSAAPGDISDLRLRTDMPGHGQFTYPVAKTAPNGDVWLFIRNRSGSDGTGELYRWNNSANSWSKISGFAYTPDAVVYPDDMAFGTDGTISLVWEWAKTSPHSLRHYGSYLRYNPATNAWSYIDGTAATVPVTLTSNSKLFFLPLQPGEAFTTSETAQGLQSVKVALDANNRPTIAYRYRPTDSSGDKNFDVWRIRWNGSAWVDKEKLYAASNDVPAGLGLTRNATRVRVYFTTDSGGLQRAMRTSTTPWVTTALAPGRDIERVNVTPIDDATDLIYGGAPTDVDANTGSVYWIKSDD
jgi:hypothetical protein